MLNNNLSCESVNRVMLSRDKDKGPFGYRLSIIDLHGDHLEPPHGPLVETHWCNVFAIV